MAAKIGSDDYGSGNPDRKWKASGVEGDFFFFFVWRFPGMLNRQILNARCNNLATHAPSNYIFSKFCVPDCCL